jgi:sugar lactone lactonase YvrE
MAFSVQSSRATRRWVCTGSFVAAAALLFLAPSASAAPTRIRPAKALKAQLITGAHVVGTASGARVIPLRTASPAAYARLKHEAARKAAKRLGPGALGAAAASSASSDATRSAAPTFSTTPAMSLAAGARAGSQPGSEAGIAAAVFGSLNEAGLSAAKEIEAFPEQDLTPPDSTGAIGPNDYVETVNAEVAVYSRSNLAPVGSPVTLSSFFNGVAVCDPQVKYDPPSERWFAVAIRCDGTQSANAVYIAFSKTSDPSSLSTGWCQYSTSFGELLEDYPKLGLSSDHIIIGTNEFDRFGFDSANVLTSQKPASGAITTCPPAFTVYAFAAPNSELKTSVEEHKALSPQPATEADGGQSGYVVAADEKAGFGSPGSYIMVWQLEGGLYGGFLAKLGALYVPPFETPPDIPQPESSNVLDSLDARLTQAVAATDPAVGEEAVWTQQTVAGGAGSVVRWYEIVPAPHALGFRQMGTISEPAADVFNGAIAPTRNGGAIIAYNTGSAAQKVQLWAQSRPYSAPLGTMNSPVSLAASAAIDSDFSCDPERGCRWGDYAGLSVDPSNAGVAWGSGMFNGPAPGNNHAQWATQNFALSVSLYPPTYLFSIGIGLEALTGAPTDVALDGRNNVWVSSAEAGTVEQFNELGEKLLSLGPLEAPCTGHLNGPYALALDANGDLWVTDSLDGVIRKFSPTGGFLVHPPGTCLLQLGSEGTASGQFKDPRGIAVDAHGNVWVSDTGNNRIQELSSEGAFERQIGPELGGGGGKLEAPAGLAVDSHGHIWVADSGNARVVELGEAGEYLGQVGATNTSGCDPQICRPTAVAVDVSGGVWVADSGNNRIDWFGEKGELIRAVGSAGSEPGQFTSPNGVVVDGAGRMWVANTGNQRVDNFTPTVPTPSVTKVEPNSGPGGGATAVAITGTQLMDASAVRFGSNEASSFTVNSATSITAVAPPGSGAVDITVSTPGGTSANTATDRFTYGPTITKISPTTGSGNGGTSVTVTGTGFKEVSGVKFGSSNATSFAVSSETSITAVSPAGSGIVDVTVTNPIGTSPTSVGDRFTYIPPIEHAEYKNWVLSGTLTDKRLGKAIAVPEGSTFNGSGEVNTETGAGSVSGNLSIPAFTTSLKLSGVVPISIGMSLSQVGSLEGKVAKSESVPGAETLSIPAKLKLGVSSLGAFGLKLSLSCTTEEPVSLNLLDTLTREELLRKGWSFGGSTTLPTFKCEGPFLGHLFGFVLSALLSGPENPFSISIRAPGA